MGGGALLGVGCRPLGEVGHVPPSQVDRPTIPSSTSHRPRFHVPSRKLLVQIKYPAGLCDDFKWPDGFADRDRPARINAIEDDDSDEDDEEDVSEVADEDDTEDADDDFGNLVHMSIKDVVRDAAPRRNGWSRIFRNPFGARSATRW